MDVENENSSSVMKKKEIWAPLICNAIFKPEQEGRYDDLMKSVPDQNSTSGVVLVGLHHITKRENQVELLQKCSTSFQPSSLGFAVLATKNLKQILDSTKYGCSMFGSDLPALWARSGKALALSLNPEDGDSEKLCVDSDGCIDLANTDYAFDESPLLSGCRSFASKDGQYTRSYVHHLIKANELLADILLFGHNLYQLLSLCREITRARQNGTQDDYCRHIEKQLD